MDQPATRDNLLRRYRWKDLTDPEKTAITDAAGIAATRAGVGVGLVLTTVAFISNARRGKPPLPRYVRYGGVPFFSLLGAYVGFLSGGPIYARRILSVPNSQLAEDLRIVVGDWQARVPDSSGFELQAATEQPNISQPPANIESAGRALPPEGKKRGANDDSKSVAQKLGLAKS